MARVIFLTKCGWHRQNTGQTLWLNVETLAGAGYQVSDGICEDCKRQLLGELRGR